MPIDMHAHMDVTLEDKTAILTLHNSTQFNSVTSIVPTSSEIRAQTRRIQIEISSMSKVKA